ncbi:MAG: GSU2403 family nucleotidyltransferase fold protein [Mogibacterium kristiansenii]|uniref:GSU2403 family nucleotidyltransferase fold protein n=1 Tax=Mogibacterium kristiansenii TaxID=2606708 RepID=UPI003F04ABA3
MSIQQREFSRFIKLLSDNDCLEHVILIGSWAEFVYQETGLLKDFDSNIKTMDMDFLIKNLRKPLPEKNIAALARAEGYLVESDVLTGVTKLYDKAGLEIEFLIGKKGAGVEQALKTNLGVTAQTLRHMEVIIRNTIEVDYFNMKITVPMPEAYTMHKIVINQDRGLKQKKDQMAISNIWKSLDLVKVKELAGTLTKKEQRVFNQYCAEHGLEI